MAFPEYKQLDLVQIAADVRQWWKEEKTFEKSITERKEAEPFVFYEGPPSANGLPGIHHVLARTLKDLFCRYKTQRGYRVDRKAGWDTHGLPVELQVEKRLGITKEDIGKKISVEDYNRECREDVLKFKDVWDELTDRIGFWLDQNDPYITFNPHYIQTLWHLLQRLYQQDLLYKGYTIQPYSPAAGTALSSHELGQPGCYRNVKDITLTAQFKLQGRDEYLLAWTTTPWTLPSNTALAVGKNISYVKVATYNRYTGQVNHVWLAKDLLPRYFDEEVKPEARQGEAEVLPELNPKAKKLPYILLEEKKGTDLQGWRYEQLLPYVQPQELAENAFQVVIADFVTTEDGTGIVHIAPTFGADDFKVGQDNNIPPLTVQDPQNANKRLPLVDREGKFVAEMGELAGRFVKNFRDEQDYVDVNIDISVKLKEQGLAFQTEKYEHSYPHCWRTDKPVLYYPMESYFIRTTAMKDKLIGNNKKINWQPDYTGEKRFGNWLENMVDWNLSRSRYWGTPLPIWRTEDGLQEKCIGSYEELYHEARKAVEAGVMSEEKLNGIFRTEKSDKALNGEFAIDGQTLYFDPHRPYVDDVVLVTEDGQPMHRVADVIDVWFDSGAMPYAQLHYPFENKDELSNCFPADFIAEGVDQTRGWFYTLHSLATMLFDDVAFKNVVVNGLVLDKDGQKMSKRLGNAIDPFELLDKNGADPVRWYMLHNAQPWDNLKFDTAGVGEVQRKFFGTLYNTYSFFSLYANIDGFENKEERIAVAERPEIDRWVISLLNTLVQQVTEHMDEYEPTRAVRLIHDFVIDHLSNWYVRLCRRRFWKGEQGHDKLSAYQTLHECLVTIAQLMAPFAPFYAERLWQDLSGSQQSVHLVQWPQPEAAAIDRELEKRMELAQTVSSMILSLRKREKIKVRQPLQRVLVPIINTEMEERLQKVESLILSEVNVKELDYVKDTSGVVKKGVKPDFKKLGPRYGKSMKFIKQELEELSQEQVQALEQGEVLHLQHNGQDIEISHQDVEIVSEDIPGWLVETEAGVTVALDVNLTIELREEGLSRELVNRIQNLRKDKGYEVTDHITVAMAGDDAVLAATEAHKEYICTEILADQFITVDSAQNDELETLDVDGHKVFITINKQ